MFSRIPLPLDCKLLYVKFLHKLYFCTSSELNQVGI